MQIRATGQVPFFGMSATSLRMFLIVSLGLTAGACTMTETQQRTGSGASIGAAAGDVLGGRCVAAWGAAIGAGGGYLLDQQKKRECEEDEYQPIREENERLQQQK